MGVNIEGDVRAVSVPESGYVLFVLSQSAGEAADDPWAMHEALKRAIDEAAPGRGFGVALSDGLQLEVLSEDDLRRIGLQRVTAAIDEGMRQTVERVLGEHRGGRAGTTCSCKKWAWREAGGGSHWQQHRAHVAQEIAAAGCLAPWPVKP